MTESCVDFLIFMYMVMEGELFEGPPPLMQRYDVGTSDTGGDMDN